MAGLGAAVFTGKWEYGVDYHRKYQSLHVNKLWSNIGGKDYLVMKHKTMIWKLGVHFLGLL